MALNTTTLETNLNTKMNATTGTTEGKEFLLLGKAVEALTPTVTVQNVINEGTTQVGLVNTAGTTQVAAVNTAGTTQVGLVNTEGSTQVAAVQAAGSNYATLSGATFTGDVDLGTNKITYSNVYSTLADLPTAADYHGMFAHVHATGKGYFAHAGSWVELANVDSSGNLVVSGSITADSFVGVVTSTVIANPTNSLGASIPVGITSSSTFSATPGVSGSTIASFTYTVEGGSETTVSASNNSATVTLPVPTGSVGDDFVVTVFATDNLGNVSGTFTQTSTLVDVLVATPVLTVTQTSYTTSSYSASLSQATTHASTNWQISTVSDFSTIVEESLLDTSNLESYTPSFTGVIGTTYYVRAQHIDANDVSSEYSTVASYTQAAIGETSYTTPGTYTFTIPAGVTSISAVCVGGGGGGTGDHDGGGGCAGALGYKNNIAVTPGASWTVTVGDQGLGGTTDGGYGNNGSESRFLDPSNSAVVSAQGGIRGFPNTDTSVASKANFTGDGGGRGGNQPGQGTGASRTGGAGAGGYNGDGASAPGYNVSAVQPASGSGAGGHGGSDNNWLQGGGGGVGILGIGADGISYGQVQDPLGNYGSYTRGRSGGGGSGGGDGWWSSTRGNGGAYGAGGGASYSGVHTGGHGGVGAVRIIWGPGRSFPNNAT